jgi:xylulose-5-phosphate/fructose-6-phosphate phosphoketolase
MACCGDVPTLETLAAVSILREHLPELKIRVVNVVDLMKLQLPRVPVADPPAHLPVLILDRFHLAKDAIESLPQTGAKGVSLRRQLQDKLLVHKQYIDGHGEDLPEVREWRWRAHA